jgi:hypothetical protein
MRQQPVLLQLAHLAVVAVTMHATQHTQPYFN